MCPMRFNRFPLDEHTCKFMVGSTNYDDTRMTFDSKAVRFDPKAGNTILDYQVRSDISSCHSPHKKMSFKVHMTELHEVDKTVVYGDAGNYSTTGFQMRLTRNAAK